MPSTESRSTKKANEHESTMDRPGNSQRPPVELVPAGYRWPTLFRRPHLLPGFSLAPRPGLLALTLLLLLGLCAALASWEDRPRAGGIGNYLLADSSSPKLNIQSAEPELIPMLEPTPMPPTSLVEPALENGFANRDSHPGDTPMIRNWKMLALQTMLAGALAPAVVQAQAQVPNSDTGLKTDPAAVTKQVDDLKKSIEAMEKRLGDSLLAMGKDLRDLITEFQSYKTDTNLKVGKAQTDIDDLKKQVAQLRQDLDALKNRPASRESAYPAPSTTPAATGRVRLVNSFVDPMTIIVNGKAYQVAPGETKLTDPLPAGTFSYEVLGVQQRLDRALAANETFTVTVHSR